jgi:hypothetical protein
MSLTLHHLLLRHLHQYACPDLTFGSGERSAVLSHAKRLWRDYAPGAPQTSRSLLTKRGSRDRTVLEHANRL